MNSMILITGATGGLGKAFAAECASRGWDLYLTDQSVARLDALSEGLECSFSVRVITRACDLADSASRAELLADLAKKGWRFWGLVNVAGLDFEGPFLERTMEEIQMILRVNIEGTLQMTRGLLARRDPLRPFRIINVASLAAFSPMPAKAIYAASKRFLLDFSLALREELREIGATVTVLCPAGLPTTPECIAAIEAQGLLGQLTTQNVGAVAAQTMDGALRGRAVVVPGWLNRALQSVSGILPPGLVIRMIGGRWKAARDKRGLDWAAARHSQPRLPEPETLQVG